MKSFSLFALFLILAIAPTYAEDAPKLPSGLVEEAAQPELTPELMEQAEQAMERIQQDPEIQALQKKVEASVTDLQKAVMAKVDQLDPKISKLIRYHTDAEQAGEGVVELDAADFERFSEALDKAKSDPAVQAAERKIQEAQTPEGRKAAVEAAADATEAVMIKNDPSIVDVLKKLEAVSVAPE